MKRADYDDEWPPVPDMTIGHYTTGFSARIEDGVPVEPVSGVGPIGFVTRRPTAAVMKRLRKNGRKTT